MSDGMTEMRREQEHGQSQRAYYDAVLAYLRKPTRGVESVVAAGGAMMGAAARAKRGRPSDSGAALITKLRKLCDGDREEWVRFLHEVESSQVVSWRLFLALSPFKNKQVLFLKRWGGDGDFAISGEGIKELIALCPERKSKKNDLMLIAFDLPTQDAVEVVATNKI